MRLTFQGTVVELGIDYDIAGHNHNGMLIDCTGNRLVFVEMPPEQLRKMPLYASIDIAIETQQLHHGVPPEQIEKDDARDARRYRYLRDSPHFNSDQGRLEWYLPRWYSGTGTRAERLDQSIDEAMKEQR
jgi:hypothetical protein